MIRLVLPPIQSSFGLVIETSSSVLVEIFCKIGPAALELAKIVESGVLFAPIQIHWDAIVNGRWRIIGFTPDYGKYLHSNYHLLKVVFGDGAKRFRY